MPPALIHILPAALEDGASPADRGTFLGVQPGPHLDPEGLNAIHSCIAEMVYKVLRGTPNPKVRVRLVTPPRSQGQHAEGMMSHPPDTRLHSLNPGLGLTPNPGMYKLPQPPSFP